MAPRDKAMQGFEQIKEAIADHLALVGNDTVYSMGRSLGIHDSKRVDKKGKPSHEGYVVYTALAHLIAEEKVVQEGRKYKLAGWQGLASP